MNTVNTPLVVRRNDAESRYELLRSDEVVGVADYQIVGDTAVMPHTEIRPDVRGQGLGDVLVAGALDDIRASGRRVVAQCWFVAQFLDQHPEYADLRAA